MIPIVLVCTYLFGLTFATVTARGAPTRRADAIRRHVTSTITATHYRQAVMGLRPTPTRYEYKHALGGMLRYIARRWGRIGAASYVQFVNPPHKRGWLCIHHFEGSWSDSGDPYWGGLQMDRGFMATYAPRLLLRSGFANTWTPLEQMWVAERAHRSGRGYGPWPKTARFCGLL